MKRREFMRTVGVVTMALPLMKLKPASANVEYPDDFRTHGLYRIAKEAIFNGKLNWEKDKVRVALVNGEDYLPDLNNHKSLDDIPHSKIVRITKPLKNKTIKGFVMDADDTWVNAVHGKCIDYLILYRPAFFSSHSMLIMCIGHFPSIVPNGGDVYIGWDNGIDKICRL